MSEGREEGQKEGREEGRKRGKKKGRKGGKESVGSSFISITYTGPMRFKES